MHQPENMIDLERYPITQSGDRYLALVGDIQTQLASDGCAVLKGFLTPDGIKTLKNQADSVADKGFKSTSRTNAYFTKDDPSLPKSDPRRQFFDRSNSFIPADNFPTGSPLRSLYESAHMTRFIQTCLQEPNFYPYADPLADVIINAADAGNGLLLVYITP